MTNTKALAREIRIWARVNALKRLAAETAAYHAAYEREACNSNLPEEHRRLRAMLSGIAGLVTRDPNLPSE
jgi:hypothetical protein